MPKLSIVIPCYNCEPFLPETLESIRAYSGMHSYEVILVDDGSTNESTHAYLETCKQINLRVIYQPHAGPAAARNRGVGHAASDYILFLDSDNKIHANLFIDKGVAVLDEHPDAGVFYGNPSFFGDVTADRIFTSGPFDFDTMLRCNYIDMCSLVRKTTWEEIGGLDEHPLLRVGYEDWDFWLRIGRTGWKFYYEDTILFDYRITKGSQVTQANSLANYDQMVCYIYQKHHDVLPQHLKDWCAQVSSNPLKVSIIVPNYNHAVYLPQRLDSILTQIYQHFELIILDDASSDNSRDIIEPYRTNPKVSHIVYNNTNSGTTFKQWDKGIQLAAGSLIWIAESDDWCEPTFLETVVKGFEANPRCVLGYTQAYAVNNEGDILWQSSHNKLSDQLDGKAYIYQYLGRGNTIFNASMAVFKREAFYAVSKDYLSYRFSGDWLFWTEIARQGDVFISGRLLSYFRNHEADVSGKAYASGLNYLEDLRVWAALQENGLIDAALYQEVLVKKYADFSAAAPYLTPTLAEEIQQLFQASGSV